MEVLGQPGLLGYGLWSLAATGSMAETALQEDRLFLAQQEAEAGPVEGEQQGEPASLAATEPSDFLAALAALFLVSCLQAARLGSLGRGCREPLLKSG